MSLSHSVFSQSGPPKSVGSGRGGGGGGGARGVVYHTSTGQYYIEVATFFFLFFEPGVKLDEKSIENGLEVQKFLVVCLFWGDCHHPNIVPIRVVATTAETTHNQKFLNFETILNRFLVQFYPGFEKKVVTPID